MTKIEQAQAAIAAMDAADKAFKAIDASINSAEYDEAWCELDLLVDAAMSRSIAALRSLRVVGWVIADRNGKMLSPVIYSGEAAARRDAEGSHPSWLVRPLYAEDQP